MVRRDELSTGIQVTKLPGRWACEGRVSGRFRLHALTPPSIQTHTWPNNLSSLHPRPTQAAQLLLSPRPCAPVLTGCIPWPFGSPMSGMRPSPGPGPAAMPIACAAAQRTGAIERLMEAGRADQGHWPCLGAGKVKAVGVSSPDSAAKQAV